MNKKVSYYTDSGKFMSEEVYNYLSVKSWIISGNYVKIDGEIIRDIGGLQTISPYIESLRQYCHGENCENTDCCPEACTYCNNKNNLDLDTAIAWELQKRILDSENLDDLIEYIRGLNFIVNYHWTKYPKLSNIIANILIYLQP